MNCHQYTQYDSLVSKLSNDTQQGLKLSLFVEFTLKTGRILKAFDRDWRDVLLSFLEFQKKLNSDECESWSKKKWWTVKFIDISFLLLSYVIIEFFESKKNSNVR